MRCCLQYKHGNAPCSGVELVLLVSGMKCIMLDTGLIALHADMHVNALQAASTDCSSCFTKNMPRWKPQVWTQSRRKHACRIVRVSVPDTLWMDSDNCIDNAFTEEHAKGYNDMKWGQAWGWSGPRASSRIDRERMYSFSACSSLLIFRSSAARLFRDSATCTKSESCYTKLRRLIWLWEEGRGGLGCPRARGTG